MDRICQGKLPGIKECGRFKSNVSPGTPEEEIDWILLSWIIKEVDEGHCDSELVLFDLDRISSSI